MIKTLVVLIFFVLSTGCSAPKIFEDERRYFAAHVQDNPRILRDTVNGIFYARAGMAAKPTLLFIHGTPGNWRFASRYMLDEALRQHANIAALDRPGWGRSYLGPELGDVLRFAEQAQRIGPLLQSLKQQAPEQPLILVGHSLGASLAPQLALDFPEWVDGMVLVAGALDPELGKPRWYNLAASMGVVSWALGPDMRKANLEIMPMHKDLADLASRWHELDIPVTVIQGMEDRLVYPANIDYAERVFAAKGARIIRLPKVGHLIPWQNRDLLTAHLIEFLNEFSVQK